MPTGSTACLGSLSRAVLQEGAKSENLEPAGGQMGRGKNWSALFIWQGEMTVK